MNQFKSIKSYSRFGLLSGFLIAVAIVTKIAVAGDIATTPLFIGQAVAPKAMINMSKDHQLFFKAYDDYSDLDDDDVPETTYKHSFNYYGYFDSTKCYKYSSNRFEPESISSDKYCDDDQWSGNFLNWATMSRMDVIRKILYGGLRSTDDANLTVLERAFLPTDAHSWAKFYNGSDLDKLTPFNYTEGLTLCNTTDASSGTSQSVTNAPLIRVAKGNFALWAANERWQCKWGEGDNGNNATLSGINASSTAPSQSGNNEYIARVQACVSTALEGNEKCKNYASSDLKPIGLLQEYGDGNKMYFGLMSGSYQNNKEGGVLRKNIGTFTNEINANGTFTATTGIINALNKLKIVGYQYGSGNGIYNNAQSTTGGGDDCIWGLSTFTSSKCRNWGNPQAELLLESLRYLAGKSATPAYSATDTVLNLTTASFVNPITTAESCASLNVIQFNASTTSYDADGLGLATDIGLSNLSAATDAVGAGEISTSSPFFIGENGTDNNQLCTAKTVSPSGSNTLSKLLGTCPDAPRLSGSYQIAGLAHYAHTNDLRSDITKNQLVNLYGIALSPALPKVVVPVPGSSTKKITILPACRNLSTAPNAANCAIVDFKIISQATTSTTATGKLYVNWEDSEQGGDFDQDQWGTITYSITGSNVTITTDAIAQSTPNKMGFGYVVNGTSQDGFHVHSGINGFAYTDPTGGTTCTNCNFGDAASVRTYTIGTANANSLEQPLFYAAKWGGFIDSNNNKKPDLQSEWDAENNTTGNAEPDGIPDKYFAATNPLKLETSLATALTKISLGDGAASAVATNSTQLNAGSIVYQAKFNPIDWSGDVEAFAVNTNTGALTTDWKVSDPGKIPGSDVRNILTYNPRKALGSRGIPFLWGQLTCPAASTSTQKCTKPGRKPSDPRRSCSPGSKNCVCEILTTSIPTCIDTNVQTDGKSQQDYLNKLPPATSSDLKGLDRVDWLRGDQENEKLNKDDTDLNHIFRKRTKLLGDAVNSDPVFVGTDDFGYGALSGVEGSSYTAFRASSAYLNRIPTLYVGTNDGMLHGFDGRKSTATVTSGGSELFAYVPNANA